MTLSAGASVKLEPSYLKNTNLFHTECVGLDRIPNFILYLTLRNASKFNVETYLKPCPDRSVWARVCLDLQSFLTISNLNTNKFHLMSSAPYRLNVNWHIPLDFVTISPVDSLSSSTNTLLQSRLFRHMDSYFPQK